MARSRGVQRAGAEAACRQVASWSVDNPGLSVSINVSQRQLRRPEFGAEVGSVLARTGIEPSRIALEITESMLMLDPGRAQAVLERLSRIGLTLSVDDFGTGYSSLANLKRLPVDVIKIDKSFVMDMAIDASDAAIVRSTIDLAHNLGLRVVAEGVESHQAWTRLTELGCDLAQGFYVSRPLPAADLGRLLRERTAAAAEQAAEAMAADAPPTLRVISARAS